MCASTQYRTHLKKPPVWIITATHRERRVGDSYPQTRSHNARYFSVALILSEDRLHLLSDRTRRLNLVRRVGALRRRRLLPRASVEHGQAPLDASGSTGTTQTQTVSSAPLDSLGGELYRACRSHIHSASHVYDSGDLFLRLTPRPELYKISSPRSYSATPVFTNFFHTAANC